MWAKATDYLILHFTGLRAESSLLKAHLDAQAKEISMQKHMIKELEEKEHLANENVCYFPEFCVFSFLIILPFTRKKPIWTVDVPVPCELANQICHPPNKKYQELTVLKNLFKG